MRSTLALNPDHAAASLSYRRAANARRHALLVPHTADREMQSVRFWRDSARFHREMADFNSGRAVRTWSFPQARDEAEFICKTMGAASRLAGVE